MMSNRQTFKKILACVSLSAMFVSGQIAHAETLDEALAYTYVANPEILSERAYLRSVHEKITQSQSGYKPTIAGQASYGYVYDRARTNPNFSENESKPVNLGLNAVQPLFTGFSTVKSVKAAKEQFGAAQAQLKNTEQSKLIEAVRAYTDVIRTLAVLKLNQSNESVLRRQLDYTQDRFRVGELTKTDVAQAEARLAGATASRISAEGDLKVSYAAYRKIIGKMPEKIFEPEVPAAKLPQTLEDAVDIALKNNPVVIAAELQAQSAETSIDVAESGHYPTLNVEASYLNSRANAHGRDLLGNELGRARDENTSVRLVLDVPLYTAGSTTSKVRESKHLAGQARINVNSVRRDIIRLTTQAWEDYQSTLASLTSLEEQVRASALALDGVRYEEQAGTRTVLDVLNAEQELLDARVSVVTAKKDLINASYQLISAIGLMTPSGLGLDIARYRKPIAEATKLDEAPVPQETDSQETDEVPPMVIAEDEEQNA